MHIWKKGNWFEWKTDDRICPLKYGGKPSFCGQLLKDWGVHPFINYWKELIDCKKPHDDDDDDDIGPKCDGGGDGARGGVAE